MQKIPVLCTKLVVMQDDMFCLLLFSITANTESQHNHKGNVYGKNSVIRVGYMNNGCHNSTQKEQITLKLSETLEKSILRCKNEFRKVDTSFVILALTSKSI